MAHLSVEWWAKQALVVIGEHGTVLEPKIDEHGSSCCPETHGSALFLAFAEKLPPKAHQCLLKLTIKH
jgi:hypothetical protein